MNIVKANIKQVNTLTKEGDRSAGYIGVPPPCGWLNFMAILQTLTIIATPCNMLCLTCNRLL